MQNKYKSTTFQGDATGAWERFLIFQEKGTDTKDIRKEMMSERSGRENEEDDKAEGITCTEV